MRRAGERVMSVALLVFLLLGFHALCDFALQPDVMVRGKNRFTSDPRVQPRWWWWLSAHGLVHGAAVALALMAAGFPQLWWLGLMEAAGHAAIDDLKCAGRIGLATDQGLHYACKLAWAAAAALA
jgi:hypothetical protein